MSVRVVGLLAVVAGAPCAFGQDVAPLGADIGPVLSADDFAAAAGSHTFEQLLALRALKRRLDWPDQVPGTPTWQRSLDAFRANVRNSASRDTGEDAVAIASLALDAARDAAVHGNPLFVAVVDRDLEALGLPPAARAR